MKKVLILGSNGLLGQSLVKIFNRGYEVYGCSLEKENYNTKNSPSLYFPLNITVRNDIRAFFSKYQPDIIINAAAFTDVDKCEKEKSLCWMTNVKGIENILEACETFSPVFIQISSDYIFNGRSGLYKEIDEPDPLGHYGFCKLAAEKTVKASDFEYIIARTMILYGNGEKIKSNFVTWILDKLKKGEQIPIVNDQRGNPTFVDDLSEAIYRLIKKEAYGTFHISGRESCSRYEFALKIAEVFELNHELIKEVSTEELKQTAHRPSDTSFVLHKLSNTINWLPSDVEGGLKKLKNQLN